MNELLTQAVNQYTATTRMNTTHPNTYPHAIARSVTAKMEDDSTVIVESYVDNGRTTEYSGHRYFIKDGKLV